MKQVIDWAMGEGYEVGMLTLTAAHATGSVVARAREEGVNPATMQDVTDLFDRLRLAWRRMHAGRGGQALKDRRVGYIRSAEVTVDDLTVITPGQATGAHFHYHVLLVGERGHVDQIAEEMAAAWTTQCTALDVAVSTRAIDFVRVGEKRGADRMDAVRLANYVTKNEKMNSVGGAAAEMTKAQVKGGTLSRRCSPEQVLRYIGQEESGSARERVLTAQWRGIEEATAGTRWITWSRDLRQLAGVGEELTEQEIVETSHEVQGDRLAVAPWDDVAPHKVELAELVDSAKSSEKWNTLVWSLEGWDIPYEVVTMDEWRERIAAGAAVRQAEDIVEEEAALISREELEQQLTSGYASPADFVMSKLAAKTATV